MIEQVAGVAYIAMVVSRLVGLLVISRREESVRTEAARRG